MKIITSSTSAYNLYPAERIFNRLQQLECEDMSFSVTADGICEVKFVFKSRSVVVFFTQHFFISQKNIDSAIENYFTEDKLIHLAIFGYWPDDSRR
jgi:hypothetical protein